MRCWALAKGGARMYNYFVSSPQCTPSPEPSAPIAPVRVMPRINVQGTADRHPCVAVNKSDPHSCQADCDADSICVAWTHHHTAGKYPDDPTWRCCRRRAGVRRQHVVLCTVPVCPTGGGYYFCASTAGRRTSQAASCTAARSLPLTLSSLIKRVCQAAPCWRQLKKGAGDRKLFKLPGKL